MRIFRGDELVGDVPVAALVDDCPLYDLAPAAPRRAALRRAGGDAGRGRLDARGAAGAARLAQPRLAPAAVRAVRLRSCSRAPCAARRRPTRPCSRCPTAAALGVADRRQRPPRGRRPVPGHDRRGPRVRGQPRVRRRRAAGRDEQPELRQSREAAHRLAADRGGARPGRRLPGARRAGRRRQRLALQRGRRPARSTRRRSSAWSGGCPTPRRAGRLGFARAGDAIALAGWNARRRWPRASWPSCAASRCPTACPPSTSRRRAQCSRRSATRCAPAR